MRNGSGAITVAGRRWAPLALLGLIGLLLAGPASADVGATVPAPDECISAGLAEPAILHPVEMRHAGVRPLTPHHFHSQGVQGSFLFSALPEGCVPGFVRTAGAQIQMQKRDDRSVWLNVGAHNGNMEQPGNGERNVELGFGPIHAWPSYLFNECVGAQGWLKVQVVITTKVKDGTTQKVVGESRYVLPAKVHGSCKLARLSKRETANYKEEWGGSGSGEERRVLWRDAICLLCMSWSGGDSMWRPSSVI